MADNTNTHDDVHFGCAYFADRSPVTVEDGPYYHVLTKKIDLDTHLRTLPRNAHSLADAKLVLTLSRSRNVWQLVSVHKSDGVHASKLNRVVAYVPRATPVDTLLREHIASHAGEGRRSHTPRWLVESFDPETGHVRVRLFDDEPSGLPYETIRAAECVLEAQGINAE